MDRWSGRVALVTGASVGIGAEITRQLAKNGLKVIPIARRLDKLEDLTASIRNECKAEVYPMMCDLRKEEDILKVFKWAEATLGGVDVLINNAGVITSGLIMNGMTDDYRKIMDVNVIAMAICSREFVQSAKRRKASGHIININSILGHYADAMVVPVSLYSASKYAVTGMTHCLRNELVAEELDIKITSISPGIVDTDMAITAGLSKEDMKSMSVLYPPDVSDAVIYVLSAPHHVQICELTLLPNRVTILPRHVFFTEKK